MSPPQPSSKNGMKTNLQEPSNSWIFLLKEEALDFCENQGDIRTQDIVTLRHPNGEGSATFLLSSAKTVVQEILTLTDTKGSWFLDESVKSNGKIHLSTPIDPIFLVLPYLQKYCSSQAIPLSQLLRDEEYPETERLTQCSGLKYLNMVSDRKGDEELRAYKYNEEKTLLWLKKKTRKVGEIMKQKNIPVTGEATSVTFVESSEIDFVHYLRAAFEIVSEYLSSDLSSKLLKFLDLTPEEIVQSKQGSKRKSEQMLTNQKKVKIDGNDCGTPCVLAENKADVKLPKSTNQSAREKARTKAAVGSKTIASFFKKT